MEDKIENKIIVRETRGLRKPDDLHKYNIYIPFKNRYINVYTCMCCKNVFSQEVSEIDELDTNASLSDIPRETLEYWQKHTYDGYAEKVLGDLLK